MTVMKWPALHFNQLVLGFASDQDPATLTQRALTSHPDLLPLARLMTRDWTEVEPMSDFWTDDRAPVEWITDRMIITYGVGGGSLAEEPLPTRP